MNKKQIAILGSTGSIGTQTLEVISENPDLFEVTVLTAQHNADLLIRQALTYVPKYVVIGDPTQYELVCDALSSLPMEILSGEKALTEVVSVKEIDLVVTAVVGFAGVMPTIKAIETKKDIALANKETLVVAGDIITKMAKKNNVSIYPVDSEHSAILQCIVGEEKNPIEKIYLTASGGPFRSMTKEQLHHVTSSEALIHPNWCMGNKVTIDSASLMNKGLEVIEAKWLFDLFPEQIDVVVHPESIVHSIVQFEDGSMKAQMGLPDMKLPIQYAMGYPKRLKNNYKRFDFMDYPSLSFERPDYKLFRNLKLAYEAMNLGGNMPCCLNAANEIVVDAFLNNKIGFLKMPDIIEKTLSKIDLIINPSLADYIETDKASRKFAKSCL